MTFIKLTCAYPLVPGKTFDVWANVAHITSFATDPNGQTFISLVGEEDAQEVTHTAAEIVDILRGLVPIRMVEV